MSKVKARLRLLRRALGMSQTELGQRLGVSQQLISALEKGTRRITDEIRARLYDEFGECLDEEPDA